MNPAPNIISLREQMRSQFPEAHAKVAPELSLKTGIGCLDALGLMAGVICEIVATKGSAGSGLLLVALIESTGEALRRPVALVDGANAFDPTQVSSAALNRLLWVRCETPEQAMRASDLLIRDGNIPRVLLDLQLCSEKAIRQIPSQAWHRLRLLAEKNGVTLCTFTSFATVPCARSRLILQQQYPLESLDESPATLLENLEGVSSKRGNGFHAQESVLAG